MDPPSQRPYWRTELERRFLLTALPELVDSEDYLRLRDLYVAGTSLRLRRVETPDGALLLPKLGQKTADPDAPHDPRRRRMTTLYLKQEELGVLENLTGQRLVKRRYALEERGHRFVIDVFEEPAPLAGLITAEVEADSLEELEAVECPPWAEYEITGDPAFRGGQLAGASTAPRRAPEVQERTERDVEG